MAPSRCRTSPSEHGKPHVHPTPPPVPRPDHRRFFGPGFRHRPGAGIRSCAPKRPAILRRRGAEERNGRRRRAVTIRPAAASNRGCQLRHRQLEQQRQPGICRQPDGRQFDLLGKQQSQLRRECSPERVRPCQLHPARRQQGPRPRRRSRLRFGRRCIDRSRRGCLLQRADRDRDAGVVARRRALGKAPARPGRQAPGSRPCPHHRRA